jgi:hypothetical protein
LTVQQLEAFLDYLEAVEKFVPTLLIVDSPYLMKLDPRNMRLDLARTVVELRGMAIARGCAVVATHQGQRKIIGARHVRSTNIAESIDMVFAADNVLTYSQTDDEREKGTARLKLEHARNLRSGVEVLLVQGYAAGKYVEQALLMEPVELGPKYWNYINPKVKDENVEEYDEDDFQG